MAHSYQPRQFYCLEPRTSACKEGFLSLKGWKQHREAVHKVPLFKSRPPQYPHVSDDGIFENENEPEGAYFIQHPILDGKHTSSTTSRVGIANLTDTFT